MNELYPDDDVLLALTADEQSGVQFIETGTAPYYLEFRKLLYRLLANLAPIGLRVFQTGDLTAEVKPGRCQVAGGLVSYAGGDSLALTDNDTNYVWLDDGGDVQVGIDGDGWPATEHIKLASIAVADGTYTPDDVTDLRGYALLGSLTSILTATPAELNKLDGASADVTAANLNELTGGGATTLHSHANGNLRNDITDPGNGGSINADGDDGRCVIGTGGAETRSLTAPSGLVGELLLICADVLSGNCVITAAAALNDTGNNTITLANTGDMVLLVSRGSAWSVVSSFGATLSTV
ncbi:MAG: hypothetical protein BIFFINMI_02918 [Phycisphaerae bacterium]|nr:hypothetical protein [Phycisphaerae bacterium]